MNIVADESIERPVIVRLRQDGHHIWSIAELSPGVSDEDVLAMAEQQGSVLLTADKDFGELVVRQQRPVPGVVLTRLEGLRTPEKADIVAAAFHQYADQLLGAFTVISPQGVRVRAL